MLLGLFTLLWFMRHHLLARLLSLLLHLHNFFLDIQLLLCIILQFRQLKLLLTLLQGLTLLQQSRSILCTFVLRLLWIKARLRYPRISKHILTLRCRQLNLRLNDRRLSILLEGSLHTWLGEGKLTLIGFSALTRCWFHIVDWRSVNRFSKRLWLQLGRLRLHRGKRLLNKWLYRA